MGSFYFDHKPRTNIFYSWIVRAEAWSRSNIIFTLRNYNVPSFIFLFDFNADLDACNGRYGVYNNEKVTWFKMVGRWQKNNMFWASIYRMELVSCLQFVVIIIITHLCRSGAWMCSSYSLSLYQKHLWLEKKKTHETKPIENIYKIN